MKDGLFDMAVKMGEYFVKNRMTNVLDTVINFCESAKEVSNHEKEAKMKFFNMLYLANKNPFMLAGGNSYKIAFKKFVEGYLSIAFRFKNAECHNREFASLTSDEMLYVLGLANRYIKCNLT
ncbi:MAG: hypothetical protein PWQ94_2204 [Thermoanaerobacterium sp.]|nr:hypothetical protein [Thermoanaerobacterium sp.]